MPDVSDGSGPPRDERMPEGVAEVYRTLWQEVAWVHMVWEEAIGLFGVSTERVDLINRTAGEFFFVMQRLLADHTILGICKLLDPAESRTAAGPVQNSTLRQLAQRVEANGATEVSAECFGVLRELEDVTEEMRKRRNRAVAHNDLATRTGSHADPIGSIEKGQIQAALSGIAKVMNILGPSYKEAETHFGGDGCGADALVLHLERGERAFKEEREARRRLHRDR